MPVSQSRKKQYAWAELLSGLAVEALCAPLGRIRCLYVAAPLLVKQGTLILTSPATLRVVYNLVIRAQGPAGLWRAAGISAVYSLLKATNVFEKVLEKPTKFVHSYTNVEDEKAPSWKKVLGNVIGLTTQAAMRLALEYPFQTVVYRMSCDLSKRTNTAALTHVVGLKSLYAGIDVTLAGVFCGALLMSLGALPKGRMKEFTSTAAAGLSGVGTTVGDALAFRMAVIGNSSAVDVFSLLRKTEGVTFFLRGILLLFAEHLVPIMLNGPRALLVNKLFRDVIDGVEEERQAHIQGLIAQLRQQQSAGKQSAQ